MSKIRLPRKLKKKLKKLHKLKSSSEKVDYNVYYPYLQYGFYIAEPYMSRKFKKRLKLMGDIRF